MMPYIKKHVFAIISLLAIFILFRYCRQAVLTAIFVLALSYTMHRALDFLHSRLNIPRNVSCLLLMLSLGSLSVLALICIARQTLIECNKICAHVADNAAGIALEISEAVDRISGGVFALFDRLGIDFFDSYDVYAAVFELVASSAASVARSLPSAAIGIGVSLPDAALVAVSAVFALFYLSRDWDIIMTSAAKMIPRELRYRAAKLGRIFLDSLKSWIKSSLFGAAISFLITLVGTCILRFDYPLIISLAAAVIDALPVVGCGLLLVPWGAFLIISGARYKGFGLIIIYAAVFLSRRISEQRLLVSKSDVHPLFAIGALCLCTRLFGITGALITPIVIGVLSEMKEQ